jgi:outer membrane protein
MHGPIALLLAFWLREKTLIAEPPEAPRGRLLDVVRLLLDNDPNLALAQSQLRSAEGAALAAAGRFDPVAGNSLLWGETKTPLTETTSEDRKTIEETLSYSQQFRGGLAIDPQLSLLRLRDNTLGPDVANFATLTFALRQPLLRGRGKEVNDAAELAAGSEVEARRLDLLQATAQRIQAVVTQYWTAKAAGLALDVLRASAESARQLLDNTRKLVDADLTPAAELVQVEANLAAKESARIGGERTLFKARQDLAREIGLPAEQIAGLPAPADPLPAVPPAALPGGQAGPRFIAVALRRRPDVRAARQRLSSADILLRAAQNELLPQLDLVLSPGYGGIVRGTAPGSFFSSTFRNIPGASLSFGLNLSWPTASHTARGDLMQAQAARQQSALAVDVLTKGIGADVPTAVDAVAHSAAQLERASASVRLFEQAVGNEEKKLRAGTSTLLDVITQRDRLTAARQDEVSVQLALATAVVQLRFATGTLLTSDGIWGRLEASRLTSVPPAEEIGPP